MGILSRFKDIMTSNINALLDKAEDPAKMIDQYLRDLEDNLAKVKSETAGVIADEKRNERELQNAKEQIEKFTLYAKKALEAGNEEDARKFLEKKSQFPIELLEKNYLTAKENSKQMKEMHDKLVSDIETLHQKKNMLKSKLAVAKTREKLNSMTASSNSKAKLDAFSKMEDKVNEMFDKASAMEELNKDSIDDLVSKYETTNNSEIDKELEDLKKSLGM